MTGVVEEIYIAREGSFPMERVVEARAIKRVKLDGGRYERGGLQSDRYKENTGYWTPVGDVCEVTLIEGEDLDEIEREVGLSVKNGEHRRNIITRNIRLKDLRGSKFRIGEVVLAFDRFRPPCKHIQDITEKGMTRALARRGGICAKVVEEGRIRPQDEIVVL